MDYQHNLELKDTTFKLIGQSKSIDKIKIDKKKNQKPENIFEGYKKKK